MRFPRVLLAACLAFVGLGVGSRPALAASDPVIQGTQEVSVPAGGGRMLLVYGLNLTKITAYELDEANGTLIAPLTVVFKSKTMAGLALPASLVSPTYVLPGNFSLKYSTKSTANAVQIRLTGGRAEDGGTGASALETSLRADLDSAVIADEATHAYLADLAKSANTAQLVGTETLAQLHNAGLLTGTLPSSVFSAYEDLVAKSRVGTGATQVAAGNHLHDVRYPLRTDLTTAGIINNAGNPVDWSQIKGVPAGLADGVDDTGASSYSAGAGLNLLSGVFSVIYGGTGVATSVARSDHNHDTSYYTQAQLNATGGTFNSASNPVDWSRVKGVAAGTGLTLVGSTFTVSFGSTSTTVAAGNHTHPTLLALTGGTMSGTLTIVASSTQAISATSGTTSGSAGGIDCVTSNGIGVAGHGNIGLLGDLDSNGQYGVWGNAAYNYQTGVYATSSGRSSKALYARSSGNYSSAVRAYSSGNYGDAIYARNPSNSSTGIRTYATGRYSTGIRTYGGYRGTGLYSRAGSYGTGIYSRGGYRGTAIKTYAYGRYSAGVYSRAGQYGTAFQAYTRYGTAASLRVRGNNATGLIVDGGYTKNLAVFQYYGSNVARINHKGVAYFNGGYTYGSADFAESVKVDRPVEEFEPGDVMVIDPKAPRQFALSREANSPLVAGVISTKPALLGTAHNAEKGGIAKRLKEEVKLGIVGIVPTKVCDEGGEIRIGDLLVSASVPGHAKKAPAAPAVGTVIGKALGALDRGTGKIEVLLMAR